MNCHEMSVSPSYFVLGVMWGRKLKEASRVLVVNQGPARLRLKCAG